MRGATFLKFWLSAMAAFIIVIGVGFGVPFWPAILGGITAGTMVGGLAYLVLRAVRWIVRSNQQALKSLRQTPSDPYKRPDGLTILAVLCFLGGILNTYSGLDSAAYGYNSLSTLNSSSVNHWYRFAVPAGLGFSILAVLLGLIQIVTAYGWWIGKPWSYKMGLAVPVIVAIDSVAYAGLYLSAPPSLGIANSLMTFYVAYILVEPVILLAIIWWYLRQPRLRVYLKVMQAGQIIPQGPAATAAG